MTRHELLVLADVIKKLALKAEQYSTRSSDMNCHILKHGQVADSQWNEMWKNEGVSQGLLEAAHELKEAVERLMQETFAAKPDA